MLAKLPVNDLVKRPYAHILPAFSTLHALADAFSIVSMRRERVRLVMCIAEPILRVAHETCKVQRMHCSWEMTEPIICICGFAAHDDAGQI